MNDEPSKRPFAAFPIGMFAVLWLVGWTLRITILSAPPLATRIADTFGLGEAGTGALTMLPVVTVAFGAVPAAWIIGRFGVRGAIVGGILVMVAASAARGFVPTTAMLFAVSAIMGLGVSVFQTALPAATRLWTPGHVALGSAVYLNGMMVGELSGAGLTLPIVLPLAGGSWQTALMLWTIPVLMIAVLVMLVRSPRLPSGPTDAVTRALSQSAAMPRWNDVRVWQFGLLLAGPVVAFYVINAYAGSLLRSRGEQEALEGLLLAYNAMPLLASVAVLIVPNWIGARRPIAVAAIVTAAALAGFAFLDGWASWIAALIAGFASTVELILLVSLPALIASGIAVTRLSAGMTLIGYAIAFVLPLIGGWLADGMGWTVMALIPSLIFTLAAMLALGRTPIYPTYE